MSGQIYLVNEDNQLVAMSECQYDSEDLLQTLLADHPSLLAGDQINSSHPRRWLLVDREFGVPDADSAAQRWSVDHLFIDQDAIPTLVEVKRSTDTRIRREVVGQMLDYAANAVSYWTIDRMQSCFESRCEAEGTTAALELQQFLSDQDSVTQFWQRVEANLRSGHVRLVFVADLIPPELRQIIEFLNDQMERVDVLGVEIKQYVSGEFKTLVPSIVGFSSTTQSRKATKTTERSSITKEEFLKLCRDEGGLEFACQAERIIVWSERRQMPASFNHGRNDGSFIPAFSKAGQSVYPFSLKHNGQLVFQMRFLKRHHPFTKSDVRETLRQKLALIAEWEIRGGMEGLPFIQLGPKQSAEGIECLLETLDWIDAQLNQTATDTDTANEN